MKNALPKIYTERLSPELSFDMVLVKGGAFMMGNEILSSHRRERPKHLVNINDFYISKFSITQDIWKFIFDEPVLSTIDKRFPVNMVSWFEVQAFIKALNLITKKKFRLPSESEWEYAARGGAKSEGYEYSGSDKLKEVAWFNKNSSYRLQSVGRKLENELGIYDMSGNVWEWVEDQYHGGYEGAPSNGEAWIDLKLEFMHVLRGGGWSSSSSRCKNSFRHKLRPSEKDDDTGFRLAMSSNQLVKL